MSWLADYRQRRREKKIKKLGGFLPAEMEQKTNPLPGDIRNTTTRGSIATPEARLQYLYRRWWVDTERRATVLDIREMDRLDGRVKEIHHKMALTATKGGLILNTASTNKRIIKIFKAWRKRLQLDKRAKLLSDARAVVMEGNLALQWSLDAPTKTKIMCAIRMPSETINPRVAENGTFENPAQAYEQIDVLSGKVEATFALYQMSIGRLSPDNFDDQGSMGRPYLDAGRTTWQQLRMTDEDLVIRRHDRATQRKAHVLENAEKEFVEKYKADIENDIDDTRADYVIQGKGDVKAVEGDANLDQIADIMYLVDTFYANSPLSKGLAGYTEGLNRDILEDLKKDYYEEIDALQDVQAGVYHEGFRLQLLLMGINPDNYEFSVEFAERTTSTKNQQADLALKYQAMGASQETVWKTAQLDPTTELKQIENEMNSDDPYPEEHDIGGGDVKITPGNGPKGESATTISTRS